MNEWSLTGSHGAYYFQTRPVSQEEITVWNINDHTQGQLIHKSSQSFIRPPYFWLQPFIDSLVFTKCDFVALWNSLDASMYSAIYQTSGISGCQIKCDIVLNVMKNGA